MGTASRRANSQETKHKKSSKIGGGEIRCYIRVENSKDLGRFRSANFVTSQVVENPNARLQVPDTKRALDLLAYGVHVRLAHEFGGGFFAGFDAAPRTQL